MTIGPSPLPTVSASSPKPLARLAELAETAIKGPEAPSAPCTPTPCEEPLDRVSFEADGAVETPETKPSANPKRTGRLRKFAAVGMVALSLLGGGLGVAGYAARTLPVCDTPVVSVQDGAPCVSPTLSTATHGVQRYVQSVPYRGRAVRDLASESNQVFHPAQLREASVPDGAIEAVTWNLHHATSRDADGARPQLTEQLQVLNESGAEVHLLQEVNPWDAQTLADQTGMVGYFSHTNPRQGNMILVDPGLEVHDSFRRTLNHEIAPGDHGAAKSVVHRGGGQEPRAVQAVRISERGSNETALLFNTHLSTGRAEPAARQAEGQALQSFLGELAQPGEAVLGGGDLNMGASAPLIQEFSSDGYQIDGARIDFLLSKGAGLSEVEAGAVYQSNGVQLSDHPVVQGRFVLGS